MDTKITEIIGCCMEVHKDLGPGLVRICLSRCLDIEFKRRGFICKKGSKITNII